MTDKEIMEAAMKAHNYNKAILAKKIGYAYGSGVTQCMRGRQAMRCDTFVKFLQEMGFRVIVESTLADNSKWELSFPKESEE